MQNIDKEMLTFHVNS